VGFGPFGKSALELAMVQTLGLEWDAPYEYQRWVICLAFKWTLDYYDSLDQKERSNLWHIAKVESAFYKKRWRIFSESVE
jgi:hypothetical protein